ncbi:inositol monophosphatase family protein [Paludibacter sp.]
MIIYEDICKKTCDIAKQAGKFIAEQRKDFDQSQVEHKGVHDLVSYVDREAEKLIISKLNEILPEAGIVGEEGTGNVKAEKYNWIIDPLDGTTNFIQGIPTYAVSIALMEENTLVVGVVYEIGQDECFYAWKDGGAFLNGNRIHVSDKTDLNMCLLATGFPYRFFDRLSSYLEFLKWILQNSRGVRRIGSAATDLAYVACGRFDAFWEYGLSPWDVAAGALLVKEAGGIVTDFEGADKYITGKDILASNSTQHHVILEKIKKYIG